jgi:hypothetical protein
VGAVHYTREQLIYRPRNPRNGRAFGFGPVEQIYVLINLALKRETWQLNYFTEGNLPDALIGVPMEWTPDQIRNFQDWFDARLAGELGKRRGATFVPGDVAKGYVATKDTELFGQAEEWLARVVCFAFSISPQPFVKMMNRATADTSQEVAIEEGLDPIKMWVAGTWNLVFRRLGWNDIQLGWEEEDDTDPKSQAETQDILVKGGLKRRNEARAVLGLDPDPSPEADMLMITTPTGAVPLEFAEQLDQAKQRQDAMPQPVPGEGGPPGAPSSRTGGSDGGGGGKPKPKPVGSASRGGSPPNGKTGEKVLKAAILAKIGVDRPVARRARAAIKRAFKAALKTAGDEAAAQFLAAMRAAEKVRKADEPDPDQADPSGSAGDAVDEAAARATLDIDALIKGLDLSSLETVVDATDAALFDLTLDSAKKALAQVGVIDRAELVGRVNEMAVAYARDRAAELVGKRWVNAGDELVDNPSPKWAITETTRTDLRALIANGLEGNIGTPAIADSIQDAYAFSEARADTIALTEVAFSNEQGKMDGWREAADRGGVTMLKGWQTSNDEAEVCDECRENEDEGLIAFDDDFPSGDDAAPAHPNCQCVTYVEVQQAEGGEDDGAED